MFRIALILGSARQAGRSARIATALEAIAPPELVFDRVSLGELPLYHEELETAPPPAWLRFRAAILRATGVLFVTPEYNRSIPAALKNAIDIGSSPDDASVWAGKPAAIVTFSPGSLGGFGANHHLRQCLVFLDVPTMAQPEMYLGHVDRLFDEHGALAAGAGQTLVAGFLTAFVAWVARFAAQ